MTVDRRTLLAAGGAFGAGALAMTAMPPAGGASAASLSIAEFGVKADGAQDQSRALQEAVDAITGAGMPVFVPAGRYQVQGVRLPVHCQILGVPGLSVLRTDRPGPVIAAAGAAIGLDGLVLAGGDGAGDALLVINGAEVAITRCRVAGHGGGGIALDGCSGRVDGVTVEAVAGTGLSARASRGLTISHCIIRDCRGGGVSVAGVGDGTVIAMNRVARCGRTGIHATGNGVVTANILRDMPDFGLRLGDAGGDGTLTVSQNSIGGADIGMGVAASGDYLFITLNMITGARNGAIRALDGERLLDPDLAQQSTEAFLNLTVLGNAVR